jgi:hypothetical protein
MDYPGHLIKVGETDNAVVRFIADRLAERGYTVTSPPGVYDRAFKAVVSLYQSQNVDRAGRALEIDGKVGSMTWGSLFRPAAVPPLTASLGAAALGVAVTQVGVMEHPLGSNSGPEVDAYLASVNLDPGNYWCMAFVHWCFQQAAQQANIANPWPKYGQCTVTWTKVKAAQPNRIITRAAAMADPSLVQAGQVFVLDFGGGHGHTGFVRQSLAGPLRTVEGNSNTDGSSNGLGVFEVNRRKIPDPTLKGFIDFTF